MAEPDDVTSQFAQSSAPSRQARLVWAATVLAIAALLVLCAGLILIAAVRG